MQKRNFNHMRIFMISIVFLSGIQTTLVFADIDALSLEARNKCYETWVECNKITNPKTCSLGIYETASLLPHYRNDLAMMKSNLEQALTEQKSKERTSELLTLSTEPHSELSKTRLAIKKLNDSLRLIETTDNLLTESIEQAKLITYIQHLEKHVKNYVITQPFSRKLVELGKIYEHTTEPREGHAPSFHFLEVLNLLSSGAIMQITLKLGSGIPNTIESFHSTVIITSASNNQRYSVPYYFVVYKDNSTEPLSELETVTKLQSILRANSTESKSAYFQVSVERSSESESEVWQ